MNKVFIPKPECTNGSGGCFTAGACLFNCRPTYSSMPAAPGCRPDRPLTEADVRRIVREEIARAGKETGK